MIVKIQRIAGKKPDGANFVELPIRTVSTQWKSDKSGFVLVGSRDTGVLSVAAPIIFEQGTAENLVERVKITAKDSENLVVVVYNNVKRPVDEDFIIVDSSSFVDSAGLLKRSTITVVSKNSELASASLWYCKLPADYRIRPALSMHLEQHVGRSDITDTIARLDPWFRHLDHAYFSLESGSNSEALRTVISALTSMADPKSADALGGSIKSMIASNGDIATFEAKNVKFLQALFFSMKD